MSQVVTRDQIMPFTFPDTITEKLNFADVLKESESVPQEYIRTLTEARQRMCDALVSQPSSQALLNAK